MLEIQITDQEDTIHRVLPKKPIKIEDSRHADIYIANLITPLEIGYTGINQTIYAKSLDYTMPARFISRHKGYGYGSDFQNIIFNPKFEIILKKIVREKGRIVFKDITIKLQQHL